MLDVVLGVVVVVVCAVVVVCLVLVVTIFVRLVIDVGLVIVVVVERLEQSEGMFASLRVGVWVVGVVSDRVCF